MRKFSSFISTARLLQLHSQRHSFLEGSVSIEKSSTNLVFRNFYLHGNAFLSSRQQYSYNFSTFENSVSAPLSTTNNEKEKRNELGVEIISIENIKPKTRTPHHLRTYEVSVLDQLLPKNLYMSFVYFYPNNDNLNCHDLISIRRQLLKQSLSETLIKFYPFAGKVQDDRHIDCNDDGVYYVEAKVGDKLLNFLNKPDNKSIHKLLPFDPSSVELLSKTYVVMVQTTVFACGGISIGLYTSHKIIDGYSLATFLEAWGNSARGCLENVCPNFTLPTTFLPIPTLPDVSTSSNVMPLFQEEQSKCMTKRFVFPASSLISLKKKAGPTSTRVMAVAGLIWKCAIAASKKQRSLNFKSYIVMLPVNLRPRSSPPLPSYSIGNVIWCVVAQCVRDDDAGLHSLVGILKKATNQVDSDFIEKMKGEQGSHYMVDLLKEMNSYSNNKDVEYMAITSTCSGGMYDVDFGWGKPLWISVGNADIDVPLATNIVLLMDTRFGDGIEAWVTLNEVNMAIFEKDPELLAFASLNPSPLETV